MKILIYDNRIRNYINSTVLSNISTGTQKILFNEI